MKVTDGCLKLQEQHIGIGRLGKIYKAHDNFSGGLVTVEQINLKQWEENANTTTEEMGIRWQNKLAKAEKILQSDLNNIKSVDHLHVFQYKSLDCQKKQINIVSQNTAGGPLSVMVRGFGKLHHTVVRRYIQAILYGLITLHEAGIVYGGLSTSSIFICNNTVKLACYFPSKATIKQIIESEILADTQYARFFLQRSVDGNEILQDIRSIAYIMIELLSGTRVRGNAVERAHLLQQLDEESIEYSFLNELLLNFGSSTPRSLCGKSFIKSSLQRLIDHPYVNINTSCIFDLPLRFASATTTSMSNGTNDIKNKEPEIVGLTQKELEKCQKQKQNLVLEIRQWFNHFERRHQRKPRMSERPASILRLQARARTFEERIQDLETRLTLFNQSFSNNKVTMKNTREKMETIQVREVEQAMAQKNTNTTSTRNMIGDEAKSSAGTVVSSVAPSSIVGSLKGGRPTSASLFAMELHAIDVESQKNEKESINGMKIATPKRSPAQKAFLKRLSITPDKSLTLENTAAQISIQPMIPRTPSNKTKDVEENEDVDEEEDDESSRKYAEAHKNGKKLMQQRRDLSIILNALEDPVKLSSSRKQSREL